MNDRVLDAAQIAVSGMHHLTFPEAVLALTSALDAVIQGAPLNTRLPLDVMADQLTASITKHTGRVSRLMKQFDGAPT